MKPFLILQLRPETEAAAEEFNAMVRRGQLDPSRVRRIRLDQEDLAHDFPLDAFAGILVGGGPGCVSDHVDEKDPLEARMEATLMRLMPRIIERDFPFLGCCYGMGILGHHLRARVSKDHHGEPVGFAECFKTNAGRDDGLLENVPDQFSALVGHKEALDVLPPGAVNLVESPSCPFQMIRYGKNVYATQFHPEASGESFALRIKVYKNNGYFHPGEADRLTSLCRHIDTNAAGRILANFVNRYGAATSLSLASTHPHQIPRRSPNT